MKLTFVKNPKSNDSTISNIDENIMVIWNDGLLGEHEVMFTGYSKRLRTDGLPAVLFVKSVEGFEKHDLAGFMMSGNMCTTTSEFSDNINIDWNKFATPGHINVYYANLVNSNFYNRPSEPIIPLKAYIVNAVGSKDKYTLVGLDDYRNFDLFTKLRDERYIHYKMKLDIFSKGKCVS